MDSARATRGARIGAWMHDLIPLLRPYRVALSWATVAMVLDAALTVLRPWPLKVVIDLVLSHRHSRVPLLSGWLEAARATPMSIVYGACAATLVIALSTGWLTYAYTRTLGDTGQRFVFVLRRNLFAHMQRLSLRFHDRQRTGDLTTRLSADINAIDDLITDSSPIVVYNAALL